LSSLYRLRVIAWKDMVEFLRDRRSIGLMVISAFLFPLLGLMVTGLKTQQEALVVIVLCDESSYAERFAEMLAQMLGSYGSFNVSLVDASSCSPKPGAVVTVAVPRGFGGNLSSIGGVAVVKVYEAIGNPAASEAAAIVETVASTFSRSIAVERVSALAQRAGLRLNPEAVLNPLRVVREGVTPQGTPASQEEAARASVARFLAFSVFFVLNPAALAVADAVSRERESGTGELLAITPLRGLEFVAGKALGSLAAAGIAGSIDLAAAFAYAAMTGFTVADIGLILLHAIETMLAVLATMSITMLLTLIVPGQRASTLITSMVTGAAIMVFFAVLFVDVRSLPTTMRALLYLIPYTHTALAIESYALGDYAAAVIHTGVLLVATAVSLTTAAAAYRPERLVKQH